MCGSLALRGDVSDVPEAAISKYSAMRLARFLSELGIVIVTKLLAIECFIAGRDLPDHNVFTGSGVGFVSRLITDRVAKPVP